MYFEGLLFRTFDFLVTCELSILETDVLFCYYIVCCVGTKYSYTIQGSDTHDMVVTFRCINLSIKALLVKYMLSV